MERNYFHAVDYVVFVFMFLISMGIGLFFALAGGGQKTTGEYLMGNRNMKLLPVSASLAVSVISANTLLGAPAETYAYGIMYFFMLIGLVTATIICAVLFVPLIYPLNLTSVNEYLEMRFKSRAVRLIAMSVVLLNQGLYVGTVIFGPATALETATGCPPWASILFVSIIGTAYTAVGGMKAVVWTDFFQSFIMVAGMVAIIISGVIQVGGVSEVWRMNDEWGRIFIDVSLDPTRRFSIWGDWIGYGAFWVGFYGVNQACVQRFCGLPTVTKGKIAMLLNGPIFGLFQTLAVFVGMVAFAFYAKKGCDPLRAEYISNANQIIPYFVMEVLNYPGLPGIFIACLFSGALSTLSSSINSMAAVVWEDVLKHKYSHLSEANKASITKILVTMFGLACMSIAFLALYIGGNLVQISASFIGASIGPLAGLFILGASVPYANWKGAVTGTLTGLFVACWMMFGQVFSNLNRMRLPSDISKCNVLAESNMTDTMPYYTTTASLYEGSTTHAYQHAPDIGPPTGLTWFYSISFAWYGFIAVVITFVVGVIVSFITGAEDPSTVDDCLLFHCVRSCCRKEKISGHERDQQITFLRMEPSPIVKHSLRQNGTQEDESKSTLIDPRPNNNDAHYS